MLRFKISLLAAFVLFTLLGLAAPNLQILLVGVAALGLTLLFAAYNFVRAGHDADHELHSTL